MSIMEKNLPVAESIADGDMVRIVTSGGASKQIDASAIGGSGGGSSDAFVVNVTPTGNTTGTSDKTATEVTSAYNDGKKIEVYFRGKYLPISGINSTTGSVISINYSNDIFTILTITFGEDTSVTLTINQFTLTPTS